MDPLNRGAVNASQANWEDNKFVPAAAEFFSAETLVQRLDHIQKQINDQLEMEAKQEKLIIGAATGLGASVLVGYVVWAFRGASLLLGALSAMPMWRCFDPLPVLVGKDKDRDRDKKKLREEKERENDEMAVQNLLGPKSDRNARQAPNGRKSWHEAL
jgi:hypothetical protein